MNFFIDVDENRKRFFSPFFRAKFERCALMCRKHEIEKSDRGEKEEKVGAEDGGK
jgi:hypothetical protein